MGIFGGGSSKRAAHVAAEAARQAGEKLGEEQERYGAYYDPYRQAGEAALGGQQAALGGVSDRISALDPRIEELRGQQAALQPQADEMYDLARQQDPILEQITSGDYDAYKQTPGYEFRRAEGLKAVEQSAAASGGLFSGQTGKALEQYGQDYGTNEYDRYLSRLYNQLGAVNTQMGGRQAALGAGQGQVNAGINLLDQDYRQIAAQMGVSDQYQNLIGQGLNAADAAARLGMNTAKTQANITEGRGQTYAGGMIGKANQLSAIGQGVATMAGTALGSFAGPMGAAAGAKMGSALAGGGGGAQTFGRSALPTAVNKLPYTNQSNIQMGAPGAALPWQQSPQQGAALRSASSFNRGFA